MKNNQRLEKKTMFGCFLGGKSSPILEGGYQCGFLLFGGLNQKSLRFRNFRRAVFLSGAWCFVFFWFLNDMFWLVSCLAPNGRGEYSEKRMRKR